MTEMKNTSLSNAEYINIESYYPNGKGVKTPVWSASENGKLYVWTSADSYKVKRISQNSKVKVCPSDAMGKPLGEWIDATAQTHTSQQAVKTQVKRMRAKYGGKFWGYYMLGKLRRTSIAVIEIELSLSGN